MALLQVSRKSYTYSGPDFRQHRREDFWSTVENGNEDTSSSVDAGVGTAAGIVNIGYHELTFHSYIYFYESIVRARER